MNPESTTRYLILLVVTLVLTFCRQQDSFYTNVLRSDVFHQLYGEHKYDFLWVFDNSPSMKSKREYVRDNLSKFLKILNTRKAVDFQMAMTTTDYFDQTKDPNNPFKFFVTAPALVKNSSGNEVILSSAANPVAEFASLIDEVKGSVTGFWEMGLEAMMQAIQVNGHKFMRESVPLVVIFLSDEQDYSCNPNADSYKSDPSTRGCFGIQPEDNPNWEAYPQDRYNTFMKNLLQSGRPEVLVFPIVGTQESWGECIGPNDGSLGTRYIALQESLGVGASGSICNSDLKKSYENIAKFLADRGIRFPLTRPATGLGINVFVNQVKVPYSKENGFYFEEPTNSIVFTGDSVPKNGDSVDVVYTQQHN